MQPFYIPSLVALLLFTARATIAATVTYNWAVTWVEVNPDGDLVRPAIGINGQWPCPSIVANVGDTVVIKLVNQLGNETTSLHFHGLFQQGTNFMDGPVGVTQCPIPPGGSFTYQFTINQPGTYWYHSHSSGQYPDGLRGPLIVHDPNSPYLNDYDEEIVLTLTDWYHDQMPGLLNTYLSASENPSGDEPVPYSNLINESQNVKLKIQPGKTYFVRVISMAAFAANQLKFDQHDMTIIEIDGVYVEKQTVSAIYVAAAQRYGVLIKAKPTADQNYAFVASFDLDMFNDPFEQTPSLNPNVTGWLVYNQNASLPGEPVFKNSDFVDDFNLVPYDGETLLTNPNNIITIDFQFTTIDGQNRAVMNNVTNLQQIVPTLYTALTTGKDATNPVVYGVNSNPYVLEYNDVVEIRLNNMDSGGHPFHLHGHQYQVVARSPPNAGTYDGNDGQFPQVPMRRDTTQVFEGGYLVLRFKADNPGVFLFHCHIEWHVDAGLSATMIEAPLQLQQQQQQSIPADHLSTCKVGGIPFAGNAAGNTKNFHDLTGANTNPPQNPMGSLIT